MGRVIYLTYVDK